MKNFAVILSGCGVFDGAEIHEAVLTLLAIDKLGATYKAFAPDVTQHHVINHHTKKPMTETRNVLTESARLVRGNIQPLSEFRATDFDALVLPGGFGVAKNLCSYAFDGPKMTLNEEVGYAIRAMVELKKPVGAMCIAPVILAKLLKNVTLTIGTDPTTEQHVQQLGAVNVSTRHGDVIADKNFNVFTTPCYMLDASISEIAQGTENLIRDMLAAM
ncbi:MAG: isoprenoid biosynthesis glyoxalase ElbB [Bacteroidota bacterium]